MMTPVWAAWLMLGMGVVVGWIIGHTLAKRYYTEVRPVEVTHYEYLDLPDLPSKQECHRRGVESLADEWMADVTSARAHLNRDPAYLRGMVRLWARNSWGDDYLDERFLELWYDLEDGYTQRWIVETDHRLTFEDRVWYDELIPWQGSIDELYEISGYIIARTEYRPQWEREASALNA